MNVRAVTGALALCTAAIPACGQVIERPRIEFVVVDEAVRLEVINWGGTGRPVVLLAGSGHTAHVFDEFAPKLRDCCHVYAVTRRGFGASSRPDTGYDDQRLADDVLAVVDALQLEAPVLVGHSMAGGEMTTLGAQHSDRVGGLVYLDALADPRDATTDDAAFMALFNALPADMRSPPREDYSSFEAYRSAQQRAGGFAFPESELRELFVANPDGSMGRYRASTAAINQAIGTGQKKRTYASIRVPILAVSTFTCALAAGGTDACIEHSSDRPRRTPATPEEAATIRRYEVAQDVYFARWKANLRNAGAPVRLVDIPRAAHHIFLSHEADVLREVRAFVGKLP